MHTFNSIAQEAGVSKRTVQTWWEKAKKAEYGEIGEIIDGARCFTDAERDILLSYASNRKSKTQPAETPTAEYRPVEVIPGNHRQNLSVPVLPQTVNLERLRGDEAIAAYEQPLAVIGGAMQLIDGVNGAMLQDIQNRIALYNQTTAATDQLQRKAEELKETQQRYRIETDLLGILQNEKTAELNRLLGNVQALGESSSSA